MAAAPEARPRPVRSPRSTVERRFALGFDSFATLLESELAWRPRRGLIALRMATIGAVAVGLEAALHIDSVLGVYIAWILVGTPQAMLSLRKGLVFLLVLAPTVALSVPLAGLLVEAPWLMLAFIAGFIALASYLSQLRDVGSFALIVQVVVMDTFYGAIYDPDNFGWSSSALYGGAVVAVLLVVLFDQFLWPDRAEGILLESLSASLARSAARILDANRRFFAATRSSRILPLTSDLPARLEILARATAEGLSHERHRVLLAAITREARLHNEIDRMMLEAAAAVPRELRKALRVEFDRAAEALAEALRELSDTVTPRMRTASVQPPVAVATAVVPALAALQARIVAERPNYVTRGADEVANLAAYHQSIRAIGDLVQHPLDAPPDPSMVFAPPPPRRPLLPLDPEAARYGVKVAVAVLAGFVTALTSHRADLSSILTTAIISVTPTYGASIRKMILRVVGVLVGGAITIGSIIIVAPNFTDLPGYMLTSFVVLLLSGYSGLGSGRTAYAGKQIGTTFLLIFVGLSPSIRVEEPLWRLWAVGLGVMIATLVSIFIWPEYAHEALAPRLRKILRWTLELLPGSTDAHLVARIQTNVVELSTAQMQLLSVADDAAIEGPASRVDPEETIDAAGTLRRIAHRFAAITLNRVRHPIPPLPAEIQAARNDVEVAMRTRLERWSTHYEGPHYLSSTAAMALAASHPTGELIRLVANYSDRVAADGFALIAPWSNDERRSILAEIESWQRLTQLFADLDDHLARVPLASLSH